MQFITKENSVEVLLIFYILFPISTLKQNQSILGLMNAKSDHRETFTTELLDVYILNHITYMQHTKISVM